MTKQFSIKEAVSFGFRKTIDHFGLLFSVMLTYVGIILGANILGSLINGIFGGIFYISQAQLVEFLGAHAMKWTYLLLSLIVPISIVMSIIMILAKTFCNLGFFKIGLEIHDYNTATYNSFFSCMHVVLRAWGASLLYSLIVLAGFIFFIIPGIYFALKYFFYLLFIIDKNVGIRRAFENSAEITKGIKLRLLLFLFVLGLVNSAGALLLGIGLLFTLPASMLAIVYVYRKLFELPMVVQSQ